jgi:hypothetical protein
MIICAATIVVALVAILAGRRHRGEQDRAHVNDQHPLPVRVAARGVAACALETVRLLLTRRVHLPKSRVGVKLRFADGTIGRVYRETEVDHERVAEPCVLAVCFRLRFVRGPLHVLFRWESVLNTPLFVGFPGFVSKLWLAHDHNGVYRGVYDWDGAHRAEHYARCLWRVLALVSARGSVAYVIRDAVTRDELLAEPERLASAVDGIPSWARLVEVEDGGSA